MPKGEQGFPPPKPQKRKESADDFALEALAAHDYEQSLKPASTRRAENADEKLPGGAADTGEKGYASIPREDSKDGSPIEATVGENRKQLKGAVEELINYQEVSPPPSFEDVRPGDMASYVGNAPADNRGVEHWTDPDPTHVIRQHTAANKAATAADFEQIRTDALEKFDASSKRILDESFGKKEEPVKAGVKTGTEAHSVPTYEQMNPKGTLKEWVMGREWVMRRNQELDKKAEGLGVGAFIKGLGEKYNKIPWQWKVGIGAALLAGTIATGGVGPLATAFAALSAGRRIAGGLGTYATVDGLLQRSYDKKARIWNSPGGRFLISATAGVLAGGALGYFLHHEAGIPAGSDEGKHARDFLAKNWPGTGAGHGVGAMHVAPIDIPAEPPGIPFHHVDAVVAHKGMGGIKLFSGLQEHLAAAYGDGPRPPSVQHILNLKPEELAKQYGFYKPDGTLDSARIIDGSALGMDDHGNVVFTPKGGSSSVLSIADKFGGRFFDSHHGAGAHGHASSHHLSSPERAALDAKEHKITANLNKEYLARSRAYWDAHGIASGHPVTESGMPAHSDLPATGAPIESRMPVPAAEQPITAPVYEAPSAGHSLSEALASAHSPAEARSIIDTRIASEGVTPDTVTALTNEAQHMRPDPSLYSYIEPDTGASPGPAVFLGQDGSLTVSGATATGSVNDMYEAQRALAMKFAAASKHAVRVLLPNGQPGYQLFNPDGSMTVKQPGLFSFGYKPPLPLTQSVYVFPR